MARFTFQHLKRKPFNTLGKPFEFAGSAATNRKLVDDIVSETSYRMAVSITKGSQRSNYPNSRTSRLPGAVDARLLLLGKHLSAMSILEDELTF